MIIRLIDGLNEIVGRIISVVAIVLTAVMIYDVVLRYVFHAPTRWGFDVSKHLYGFYFRDAGRICASAWAHVRVTS